MVNLDVLLPHQLPQLALLTFFEMSNYFVMASARTTMKMWTTNKEDKPCLANNQFHSVLF